MPRPRNLSSRSHGLFEFEIVFYLLAALITPIFGLWGLAAVILWIRVLDLPQLGACILIPFAPDIECRFSRRGPRVSVAEAALCGSSVASDSLWAIRLLQRGEWLAYPFFRHSRWLPSGLCARPCKMAMALASIALACHGRRRLVFALSYPFRRDLDLCKACRTAWSSTGMDCRADAPHLFGNLRMAFDQGYRFIERPMMEVGNRLASRKRSAHADGAAATQPRPFGSKALEPSDISTKI